MISAVAFLVFGGVIVLSSLLMVFTRNVIHGVYGLAMVLLSIAGLFVLLNADFLAVVQIFMYAGGVVVLLVFGIMLTNRNKKGPPLTGHQNRLPASLATLLLMVGIFYLTLRSRLEWAPEVTSQDQTKRIGELFLTDHILAFELIALLLLAVLVGASFIAKKSSQHD